MADPEEEKEKKKKEEEARKDDLEKRLRGAEGKGSKSAELEKELRDAKKEEPKEEKKEDLEDKVKKEKGFFGKAFDLLYHAGMAVATTAIGLATAGTAAPIISGAFGAAGLLGSFFSKKEKPPLFERVLSAFRTYSVINAILAPMVSLGNVTYPLIDNSTLLGKAARTAYAVGPYNMVFSAGYKAGDHLIKNKFDFRGIDASVKDNFWPMYKRFAIGFSPGLALTANGITDLNIFGYKAPTFAVNAVPLGIYNGISPPGYKPKEEKKPLPKTPATQPTGG